MLKTNDEETHTFGEVALMKAKDLKAGYRLATGGLLDGYQVQWVEYGSYRTKIGVSNTFDGNDAATLHLDSSREVGVYVGRNMSNKAASYEMLKMQVRKCTTEAIQDAFAPFADLLMALCEKVESHEKAVIDAVSGAGLPPFDFTTVIGKGPTT